MCFVYLSHSWWQRLVTFSWTYSINCTQKMANRKTKDLFFRNVNMKNILKTLYSELIPNHLPSIVFYPGILARTMALLPLNKMIIISEIVKLVAVTRKWLRITSILLSWSSDILHLIPTNITSDMHKEPHLPLCGAVLLQVFCLFHCFTFHKPASNQKCIFGLIVFSHSLFFPARYKEEWGLWKKVVLFQIHPRWKAPKLNLYQGGQTQ